MAERRRYYASRACSGHLDAGRNLEIRQSTYFHPEKASLSELVRLPLETLEAMSLASIGKEEAIYEKLCAATEEWETQAQETGRLDAAVDYVRTKEVVHTANQWKKGEYDYMEISNRVYKMEYRVREDTHYDRKLEKPVPDAWYLTWSVSLNAPMQPNYNYRSDRKIAGQDQKRFTDKAEMDKYLQGRIAIYADLFTEISPPIPEAYAKQFCIHGELRPGYTVEAHKPSLAELLDLLDDEDVTPTQIPDATPAELPHEEERPKPAPAKKHGHHQRGKSAPVR